MIQEHVSRIALWSPHRYKRIFHTLPLLCFVVCYSFCFKSPLCVFLCLSCPRDIQFVSKILSTCFCFNTLHCLCSSVLLSPLFLVVRATFSLCPLSTCTLCACCMFLCIIIVIPSVYNIHNNNNGHMYNLVCTG